MNNLDSDEECGIIMAEIEQAQLEAQEHQQDTLLERMPETETELEELQE